MGKPKGKTPSLLAMSTGTPAVYTCGKSTACGRCKEKIVKGTMCFQIPRMKSGFISRPIFCIVCTSDIISQTKADIVALEEQVKPY